MLTLQNIKIIQESEGAHVSVDYFWEDHTKKPEGELRKVWITFQKPHPLLWKYLMTETTNGFEIAIRGTRNKIHDGLDLCYAQHLEEVNRIRSTLKLSPIHK